MLIYGRTERQSAMDMPEIRSITNTAHHMAVQWQTPVTFSTTLMKLREHSSCDFVLKLA